MAVSRCAGDQIAGRREEELLVRPSHVAAAAAKSANSSSTNKGSSPEPSGQEVNTGHEEGSLDPALQ
jgi:hypothetical protein